jgi:hypothetical protein
LGAGARIGNTGFVILSEAKNPDALDAVMLSSPLSPIRWEPRLFGWSTALALHKSSEEESALAAEIRFVSGHGFSRAATTAAGERL